MNKPRIGNLLIIDDEIETLNPLCDLLSKWGYKVTACTSGREALETLRKQDIDVMLTDLVMPEMDGIQLILAAMNIDPHVVSIIITGQGTIQTAVEAMKVGAFDLLVKPLDFKMLRPILSRAVEVQRLRQSEARYRSIVEDQTELICRFLPDGTLTFVNEPYCRYFARKEADLIGHSFLSRIPEEDREEVKKHIFSLNIQNRVETHENRVINSDGEIAWQRWTNRVLFDDHKNIIEYQSVGRDITERKKMEEALLESQTRYRELADSITDVFFAVDNNLNYTYWNKPSEDLTGISAKDAIGKSLYEIFPDTPETRRAEKVYLDVLRTQQPQTFINRYQIRDKEHYFEIDAYPSRKGLSVFVKDVTGRKQIEEALQKSEARYRDLYDNAPDMCHTLDENGVILDCNQTEAKMLGYEKREIIGKHITNFFTEESRKRYETDFPRLKEKKELSNLDREFIRKDGTIFSASLNVFSVCDEEGRFIGAKTIARDITQLKQIEDALRRSEHKIRMITDNIPALVSYIDIHGRYEFVNARYEEWFGISRSELIGKHVREVLGDAAYNRIEKYVKQASSGHSVSFENDIHYLHGGKRWANVSYIPDIEEGGKVNGFYALVIDITERKRMEEALKESEEKYKTLADSALVGIYKTNLKGDILYVNEALLKMLEYDSPEKLLSANALSTYKNPDDRALLIENLKRMSEVRDFETELLTKTGKFRNVIINVTIEGDVMSGMILDITERKKAEEALRESEERFRSLSDAAFEGIVFHKKGVLLRANDQFFTIFGYEPDELIGKQMVQILVAPEAQEFVKKQIAGGKQGPYESIGVRKNGTKFPMEIRARQIELKEQKIRVTTLVDITERKKVEQALKERGEELAQKTMNLEEVNTALKVLLDKRDDDKLRLEESILLNIHELVEPYSEKLRKSGLNELQKNLLEIMESNLKEIVSSFAHTLSASYLRFTPTEIQIANLIKQGKTSKEIGELLCVTPRAISFHRDNIRKKLGLNNKKTNLKTYLSSLQ